MPLSASFKLESFRSVNVNEDEYEFCPREVWCFVFALVFELTQFVTLEWKQPVSRCFPCFFHVISRGKNRVVTAIMLYRDDIIIFDGLEVPNSPLQISFSWRRVFLKISLSKSGRQLVFHLRDMSRATTHVNYDQANKLVLVLVLVLGSNWYNGQFLHPEPSADYERMIVFVEPISDKVLLNHVIRRELVSDEGQCRLNCYLGPGCVSINVGPMNQVTKTCDLNNATVDSSPGSTLEQKIGYLHLAVEVRVN